MCKTLWFNSESVTCFTCFIRQPYFRISITTIGVARGPGGHVPLGVSGLKKGERRGKGEKERKKKGGEKEVTGITFPKKTCM